MPSPEKKSGSVSPLQKKLSVVRLVILDVDGVLTDGTIQYDDRGGELKSFHVHDGFGIARARALGLRFAIATGRQSVVVTRRARELGIADLFQNCRDKVAVVRRLQKKYRLAQSEICCMTDDEQDIEFLLAGGLRVVPSNALAGVKKIADIVTRHAGGNGAVREVVDRILRAKKILDQ
jgi:3-deoxy-D-manno-octulosonate 8-phosphate phosphatase (KDO 8-P phosphatase)